MKHVCKNNNNFLCRRASVNSIIRSTYRRIVSVFQYERSDNGKNSGIFFLLLLLFKYFNSILVPPIKFNPLFLSCWFWTGLKKFLLPYQKINVFQRNLSCLLGIFKSKKLSIFIELFIKIMLKFKSLLLLYKMIWIWEQKKNYIVFAHLIFFDYHH